MLDKILGFKAYIATFLVAAVLAGAGGFGLAWKLQDGNIAHIRLEQAQALNRAVAEVRAEERAAAKISSTIGARAADQKVKIQTVTKTLIREVPRLVTPEADHRCIVPVGAVRLLNAAAAGTGLSELADTAGEPDDAPSGIDLSEVVAVVADNYGAYHEVSDQLRHLEDWVTAQETLAAER